VNTYFIGKGNLVTMGSTSFSEIDDGSGQPATAPVPALGDLPNIVSPPLQPDNGTNGNGGTTSTPWYFGPTPQQLAPFVPLLLFAPLLVNNDGAGGTAAQGPSLAAIMATYSPGSTGPTADGQAPASPGDQVAAAAAAQGGAVQSTTAQPQMVAAANPTDVSQPSLLSPTPLSKASVPLTPPQASPQLLNPAPLSTTPAPAPVVVASAGPTSG
jgi:hypothetical protein